MGKLSELNNRYQAFVSNMNLHIAEAIMVNDNELTDMNKKQMLASVDSNNSPFVHKKTGSTLLSPAYARQKGKSKPNLFDTSSFQRNMFLTVNELNSTYFITSDDEKTGFLIANYGIEIFGIFDKQKAKELNAASFKRLFEQKVLLK